MANLSDIITPTNLVTKTGTDTLTNKTLTSPILTTPALGTPASGVATNLTGTAASLTAGTVTTNANLTGHITSTGNATVLGSFTSAQLATALTNETGSGAAVFGTSPTLVTPALGTPASGVMTNATGLPLTTGVTGTLPVANGGTGATSLTANNVVLGNGTSAVQVVAPSTSGNVLTSNGSTWASTAPAPSGGVRSFTATGTIGNGAIVTLKTDGTVKTVTKTVGSPTAGTEAVFKSATASYIGATYDPDNNKVVIAYDDDDTGDYGQAVVGTVSGNTITFGTPVTFASAATWDVVVTYDTNSEKVVIAYRDAGNSYYGTAIVGTVSGDSISFGSEVVYESGNAAKQSIAFDSNLNKIVVAYVDYGNSQYVTAAVGTVSGTSISFGTPVVVYAEASGDSTGTTFDSNSNKIVINYKTGTGSGESRVGTVSGTSISFGTAAAFEGGAISDIAATFDSDSNKVVVAYQDTDNSSYGTAAVGTVSGTDISFGTPVVFSSEITNEVITVFDSNANKIFIGYSDKSAGGAVGHGTGIVGTVSGTSISFGTALVWAAADTDFEFAAFDSTAKKVAIAFRDRDNSSYGTGVVFDTGPVTTDVNDEIGIAAEAGTDGNPLDVTILGGVNASQSGLTIAGEYWAADDGTLSSSDTGYQKMGVALSATELLIRGNS